jgi:hypothetical protein
VFVDSGYKILLETFNQNFVFVNELQANKIKPRKVQSLAPDGRRMFFNSIWMQYFNL